MIREARTEDGGEPGGQARPATVNTDAGVWWTASADSFLPRDLRAFNATGKNGGGAVTSYRKRLFRTTLAGMPYQPAAESQ